MKEKKGNSLLKIIVFAVSFIIVLCICSVCCSTGMPDKKVVENKQVEEVTADIEMEKNGIEMEKNKDLEVYNQKMSEVLIAVSNSFDYMSDKLINTPEFWNWSDADAVIFVSHAVNVKNNYKVVKEMTPPEEMVSIHNLILEGMGYYDSAIDDMIKGMDSYSADLFNSATVKIYKGNELIDQATLEIKEME